MSRFTSLHTHTHYSLLDAIPKIPELVKSTKEQGMSSLAITDNGNLYGAIEFFKECKKNEIKPIIGVNFYIAPRTINDKEFAEDKNCTRLVLLAKNFEGYKNLIKLVTISNIEGFFLRPRIDFNLLKENRSNLFAIIPSNNSLVSNELKSGNSTEAEKALQKFKTIFSENCFLEISHHPEIENHEEFTLETVKLGKKCGVSIVATNEIFYIEKEDRRAWEVIHRIQSNTNEENLSEGSGDFSFINEKTSLEYFKDFPEALANNEKIANECNLEMELGKWTFPKITIESGRNADEELRHITYEGLPRRGVEKTPDVTKRIEYELEIIKMKGFAPYFLIVADLLKYAREHGILSNIRGSVSGSLVTFLSGITNINPLEFQIPFERFLNPERPGAPDIDMDYADDRRDEMIEYAREKYGKDQVAQIGTFGTMMARGAVRDVARALGYPYGVGDRIAKMIPMGSQGFPMTIDRAIEITPELKEIYEKESDVKEIIEMAKKIEGNVRHISVHAAGVVIAPGPLVNFTPLQLDPKETGKIITQYDMYSITDEYGGVGLLKFDFLGLKNLSTIADTLKIIKNLRDIEIDSDKIPLDDKKTFEMLARGETADTFQLNGTGMTRFLMDLKPTAIHDINAMVALYRPGPMQFIPEYIERKHDPSKIKYLDKALEPILEKTYGILVYQDDLLMMANQIAGYSWGEVDKFRKAVGKKIPAEMEAQREKFIKGVVEHSGWSEKKATELWTWIEPFAAYGFNKAHSVSYGRVAYLTAYLKANYPGEYMTAVLTGELGEIEKVAETVAECKRMGIPVLPPDINESFKDFVVIRDNDSKESDRIRFGLGSIKNFGEGIAEVIMNERQKNGKFKSLSDFLSRIKDRNLNKKSLEALIYAGALDEFEERGKMIANLEELLSFNKEHASNSGGMSLFQSLGENADGLILKESEKMPLDEKLRWEKELLGLYISGHPLDKYKEKLEGRSMTIKKISGMQEGMMAVVSGIVVEVKPLLTKGGDRMCFLKMADYSGNIEVVLFPRTLSASKDLVSVDKCIAIKGKVSKRNGGLSLIADAIKAL